MGVTWPMEFTQSRQVSSNHSRLQLIRSIRSVEENDTSRCVCLLLQPLKFDPFLDIHSDEIKFQVMVVRAIEVSEDSDLNLGMSCASQGSGRSLGCFAWFRLDDTKRTELIAKDQIHVTKIHR
ncbi:hypothetical protein Tco_0565750 [Tanacetum coccineum]